MGCVFVYKFETMFGTVKTWKERSLGGNYEGGDGWSGGREAGVMFRISVGLHTFGCTR